MFLCFQVEPDQLRKRQWDDNESDDVTNTSENHDVSKKRIKEESSIKTEPTDNSAKEVCNMK